MMEEQQSEGPVIKSSPYQSPMYNFGGSIILLTNPENELFKMELTLKNLRVDSKGNALTAGEALMNDLGVSSVIGQVQAIVNQVTVMSNLNKLEVPMIMDFLGDSLAKDLMINRKKYAIIDGARDKIYYTALTSAFICMKRAFEEGEKRFWKGSQQEITTRTENQTQRGGVSLFPWGQGQKQK
jgi:hypothetical protein